MKYANLVYAKHDGNHKVYLFGAPLDQEIKKGERLVVRTGIGIQEAAATESNFIVPEKAARAILENSGGYYPPAPVVARLKIVQKPTYVVTVLNEEYRAEIRKYIDGK